MRKRQLNLEDFMKYGTKLVYGIDPKTLANMRHIDALRECLLGVRSQIYHFTHNAPSPDKWCSRRKLMLTYLKNAEEWLIAKLAEFDK